MAEVKVEDFPAGKIKDGYDAGKAYRVDHLGAKGTRREAPKTGEDGFPIINELRGMPELERKRRARGGYRMVTPSGVVIHSPMSHGSGRGVNADPERKSTVLARLHNRGCIRYGECPLRNTLSLQWLTAKQRKQKPCEPGTYNEYNPCEHIEAIIKDRKEKHAIREAKANERYKTLGQKTLELEQENRQDMRKLISGMAARPTLTGDEPVE